MSVAEILSLPHLYVCIVGVQERQQISFGGLELPVSDPGFDRSRAADGLRKYRLYLQGGYNGQDLFGATELACKVNQNIQQCTRENER